MTEISAKIHNQLSTGELPFRCALPVSYPVLRDHMKMAFEVLTQESSGERLTFINTEGLGHLQSNTCFSEQEYGMIAAEVPKGEAWCVLVSNTEVLALKIRTPASPDFWSEASVEDL